MAKTNKQKRIFRPWEADEIRNNKASLRKALESPHVEDKSAVRAAINRLSDMETEHAVPQLSPEQRDKASKRVKELEGQIQEGMLSHEEMRRNPPGAVDQNVWWERRNKQRIRTWRNLNLALHAGIPADQAQSLTSLERLRPRTSRLNMDGAQIPSTRTMSFPSEQFKENWPAIFAPKEEPELEASVVDEPEPLSGEDELMAEAGLDDKPETQRALGALARRRGGAQPGA
jgi:hypothetical protein